MVKKKFYSISLAGLLLFTAVGIFSSCGDFFDVDPENGARYEDIYTNIEHMHAGAMGIYAALAPEVHNFLLWGSARADMVTVGEGKDVYVSEFVNNYVTTLNPYTNYDFLYKAIARCNHHLSRLPEIYASGDYRRDQLSFFYAEAYYLRALCYFYLVRTYRDFPIVTEDFSDRVVHVKAPGDTVYLNALELSDQDFRDIALQAAPEQDVWKLIVSDLNKVLGLIGHEAGDHVYWWGTNYSIPNEFRYIRPHFHAVFSLATEVALWLGRYEEAAAYAADAMVDRVSPGEAGAWTTQFTGNGMTTLASFIFAYTYTNANETNRLQEFTALPANGGKYLLKPVLNVVNDLFGSEKDLDVRWASWMRVNRKEVIWKYIGRDNTGALMREPYQSDAPWLVFKTADPYLWRGIAENRLGNWDAGFYYLNLIRLARGVEKYQENQIPRTMEALEDLLFRERTRETLFEGKRWYDLMLMERMGRTGALADAVSKKYPVDEQAAMKAYLSNPAHWYLPVDPSLWQ